MATYERRYTDLKYIGKPTVRKDARDIVTGKARFLDDFTVPGMIFGRCLRSPHPHAMIREINVEKAKAYPGVHAVLTYRDVNPDWKLGWPPQKKILDEHLRYVGDSVAFVAADTVEIADAAIDLIEVEYEVLPAALNGWDAAEENAAQLYPELFERNEVTPGFPVFQPEGPFWHLERGDVEQGFRESAFIIEDRVEYNKMPNPNAPEPPGVIVQAEGDMNFTVWATSQGSLICKQLASFAFPGANFKVRTFNTGGSYGNKQALTGQVACGTLLSMATGRPVKVFLTKAEQLLCFENRLGSQIDIKIGVDQEGIVNAVQGKWTVEAGGQSNATQGQVGVGLGEANLIMAKCGNWDLDSELMATNRTPAGIARGYGGMELNACLNILFCRALEAGGFDPVEAYKKNYISDGDFFTWRDGITWKAHTMDFRNMIQAAADKFGWAKRWKGWGKPSWVSADGRRARGVGVGIIGNADAGEDNNEAYVRVTPDIVGDGARVTVQMDVTESGMGQRSNLAKMAAEILNVPYEKVDITAPGTGEHNPNALGLCGSRGTITYGRPVCDAAEDVRSQLFRLAEPYLRVPPDTMELVDYGVRAIHRPDKFVTWKQLLPKELSVTGYGKHVETFGSPSCCIVFLEVEVDLETGKVDVIDMLSGADVGQIIDPAALEMQMQGGIGAASMDSALYEENVVDAPTGRTLTYNMIDYKWRPFNQFPSFETSILESQFDTFQFKAVGIGEITGAATAPAVMQAISNAIGTHVSEYPATPQVVLRALGKLKEEAK